MSSSSIQLHFHCKKCLTELPEETSPSSYSQLTAGWTKEGLQVWCERHDLNIIHIDFEGVQHTLIGDNNEQKSKQQRKKSTKEKTVREITSTSKD